MTLVALDGSVMRLMTVIILAGQAAARIADARKRGDNLVLFWCESRGADEEKNIHSGQVAFRLNEKGGIVDGPVR